MLRNSFIHIPGVGQVTERRLWEKGLTTWDHFLDHRQGGGLGARMRQVVSEHLLLSREALSSHNHCFFEQCFPQGEKWRLFHEFQDSVAYLDIETTGLSPWYGYITVIGLYNGEDEKAFVMGENLHEFADEIARYKMVVTFNGARFDLPFIRQSLRIQLDHIHIDLLYPLKRLGYSGGLKAIEQELGIFRPADIEGIDGFEAVRLWFAYQSDGKKEALDRLIRYNLEDTRNLKILMELAYEQLKEHTFPFPISGAHTAGEMDR
jgi:uncharacterized protein YprB with RNaseH-like and TPR domain